MSGSRDWNHLENQISHIISRAPTSITAFVGWAAKGPTGKPPLVKCFEEYQNQFGDLDSRSYLGYAVRQFFKNGGEQAYIVRLATEDGTVLNPAVAPGTVGAFEKALDAGPDGTSGIHQLDKVDFNLLCVPGETDPATMAQLENYCSGVRAFYIADCRAEDSFESLQSGPDVRLMGLKSSYSGLYFPWVKSLDPQSHQVRLFPPSGFVAGIFASIDSKNGVWMAPAGVEAILCGVEGLAVTLTDEQNGLLDSKGINCIRWFEGRGAIVWGAQTSDQYSSEMRDITTRRLALLVEDSLLGGTAWVSQETIGEELCAQIRESVGNFLVGLFKQGAFQGSSREEAYAVECGLGSTMTGDDMLEGNVNLTVMIAPSKPSVFKVITLQLKAKSGP